MNFLKLNSTSSLKRTQIIKRLTHFTQRVESVSTAEQLRPRCGAGTGTGTTSATPVASTTRWTAPIGLSSSLRGAWWVLPPTMVMMLMEPWWFANLVQDKWHQSAARQTQEWVSPPVKIISNLSLSTLPTSLPTQFYPFPSYTFNYNRIAISPNRTCHSFTCKADLNVPVGNWT